MLEWIRFFATIHKNVSELEARKIFYRIDTDNDGLVELSEFLPIVFSKANKQQLALIQKECEGFYTSVGRHVRLLRLAEMEKLFDCYDADHLGYVYTHCNSSMRVTRFIYRVCGMCVYYIYICTLEYCNNIPITLIYNVYYTLLIYTPHTYTGTSS